jgi:hypothetical protein
MRESMKLVGMVDEGSKSNITVLSLDEDGVESVTILVIAFSSRICNGDDDDINGVLSIEVAGEYESSEQEGEKSLSDSVQCSCEESSLHDDSEK